MSEELQVKRGTAGSVPAIVLCASACPFRPGLRRLPLRPYSFTLDPSCRAAVLHPGRLCQPPTRHVLGRRVHERHCRRPGAGGRVRHCGVRGLGRVGDVARAGQPDGGLYRAGRDRRRPRGPPRSGSDDAGGRADRVHLPRGGRQDFSGGVWGGGLRLRGPDVSARLDQDRDGPEPRPSGQHGPRRGRHQRVARDGGGRSKPGPAHAGRTEPATHQRHRAVTGGHCRARGRLPRGQHDPAHHLRPAAPHSNDEAGGGSTGCFFSRSIRPPCRSTRSSCSSAASWGAAFCSGGSGPTLPPVGSSKTSSFTRSTGPLRAQSFK